MNAPLYRTLEGLKRRAKRLKRETGCSHAAALDQMARLGGYDNFAHARRALTTPVADDGTVEHLSGGQFGKPAVTRIPVATLRNRKGPRP